MNSRLKSFLPLLNQNWRPALTVALVNIPLSLSIAIASGATPLQGIITAVWAGLIGGMLGGSNYNVVGPTGALSGLIAAYSLLYGWETLPFLTMYVGMVIFSFYFLRWYRYIIYIPLNVIHGFILGVAIIIILNQIDFALGLSHLPQHKEMILNAIESLRHAGNTDTFNLLFFLFGMVFLFVSNHYLPKIPAPLLLSALGILVSYLVHQTETYHMTALVDKYGSLDFPLANDLPVFHLSLLDRNFFIAGFVIAVIAILETLISGRVADSSTGTSFERRREVFGLGLANIASGICGGIPATAALARTSLNIKAHATHRTSASLNAIFVAVIALMLLPLFKYLPLASVASILVYVASKMVDFKELKHLYQNDKKVFSFSMLVAFLTVVEEPIIGILVGAVISLLNFVNNLSKGHAELTVLNTAEQQTQRLSIHDYIAGKQEGDILIYRFAGTFTYVTAPAHIDLMNKIKGNKTVILSFRNLFHLDIDGIIFLADMIKVIEKKGSSVILAGVSASILPALKKEPFYKEKINSASVYESTSAALSILKDQKDISP